MSTASSSSSGRGVGVAEVGRAEERGAAIGDGLDEAARRDDLEPRNERAGEREVRVRVRVVSDLVAFAQDAAHDAGILVGLAPHDEEGRLHAARLERVEDGVGVARVGAVVEGDRDFARIARAEALHDPWRRKLRDALVRDDLRLRNRTGGGGGRATAAWRCAAIRLSPRTADRSRRECPRAAAAVRAARRSRWRARWTDLRSRAARWRSPAAPSSTPARAWFHAVTPSRNQAT